MSLRSKGTTVLAALIVTLREGMEAALVIGLTLSYLQKTGRRHLRGVVWTALGLAILGSVLAAWLLQLIPVNAEAVEGTLMLVAAIFVGTTLVWMHRHARHLGADIRQRVDGVSAEGGGSWALGLFVFFMVLREGAETVLFLSAISVSTSGLLSFVGAAAGLALAAVVAVAFFKGALQLDLKRFFAATTFILAVLVVELLVHAYHEFSEVGLLPANETSMAIVGPVVKNSVLFVLAVLAFPMVLFLVPSSKPADPQPELAGPEARRLRAARRQKIGWSVAFLVLGVIVMGVLVHGHVQSQRSSVRPPATAVQLEGGAVRIPLEGLARDTQHVYSVSVGGRDVRFFVYLVAGDPRVCLDACEICGDKGYHQEGPQLICINCGAEINPPTLGATGGCNPIPLAFTAEGGAVRIEESALTTALALF